MFSEPLTMFFASVVFFIIKNFNEREPKIFTAKDLLATIIVFLLLMTLGFIKELLIGTFNVFWI
ncbi:MAG: hypothetical protein H0Z32_10450 [Bacillaceae bacterium]|nr:hypothetical protein [Bacillaceae bacterium]